MSDLHPTISEFIKSNFDPQMESRFFGWILLANSSYKATNPHRLDDLNAAALPLIREIPERPLEILDVAVSSGISTQEWYEQLVDGGIETRLTGTDAVVNAFRLKMGPADCLLDKDQHVIHLSLFEKAIKPKVVKWLRPCGLNLAFRMAAKLGRKPDSFPLVSRAVKDVAVVEEDMESENENERSRFHVIRAANILNLVYLPEERLQRVVKLLLRRLRPNGLFIVCRTNEDGSNHASIFQFDGERLTLRHRLGSGSEIEYLL